MHIDQAINEWGLEQYRQEKGRWSNNHLAACPTTTARGFDARWSCGCYSEYTRDDRFELHFDVSCECGESTVWSVGDWDLPMILQQLVIKMETYNDENYCRVGDDYDWGYED